MVKQDRKRAEFIELISVASMIGKIRQTKQLSFDRGTQGLAEKKVLSMRPFPSAMHVINNIIPIKKNGLLNPINNEFKMTYNLYFEL